MHAISTMRSKEVEPPSYMKVIGICTQSQGEHMMPKAIVGHCIRSAILKTLKTRRDQLTNTNEYCPGCHRDLARQQSADGTERLAELRLQRRERRANHPS